jgi:hypothetical protein
MQFRKGSEVRAVLILTVLVTIPVAASAQTIEPLSLTAKLNFHAESTYAPLSLVGIAAYAAVLQEADAPEEWKQGAAAYGQRFGSTLAWS